MINTGAASVTVNAAAYGPDQRHGEVLVIATSAAPVTVALGADVAIGRCAHIARDGAGEVTATGNLRAPPAGVSPTLTGAGASMVFPVTRNPDGQSAECWQVVGSAEV